MDTQVLPQVFIDRLENLLPEKTKEEVLAAFCAERPTTFRTNTLKITTPELEEELTKKGINYQKVSFLPDAFILEGSAKQLTTTGLFDSGLLYVQSLSSMIPALVLEIKQNENVLDMTAAPGSKTSQIAALMENTGHIVANDISRVRLYKLRANLKLLDVKNTTVIQKKGQDLWKSYNNFFDKVLVDAPCSLEGRFQCQNPKTYRTWNIKKVKQLSHLQRYLLRSALTCAKPGGVIVYSTCTLSPEENEEALDWLLTNEKNSVVLEPINLEIPEKITAFPKWQNKVFDPQIKNAMRILPSSLMEGFFVAKLRKVQ